MVRLHVPYLSVTTKLASGFCIPEPLPVHTGIKGRQVHALIRFLLRSRVDEKCADLHKPFISYLFLVGVTVQSPTTAAPGARPQSARSRGRPPASSRAALTLCFLTLAHDPFLPAAKRVRFGDAVPPHAPLASPVWDPGSSARMPQNAPPSVPSSPSPFRCTTTGTSIVPLEPLARHLEAWLTLPSPSRWLTRTIRLG